jgi:hypothetical protein
VHLPGTWLQLIGAIVTAVGLLYAWNRASNLAAIVSPSGSGLSGITLTTSISVCRSCPIEHTHR